MDRIDFVGLSNRGGKLMHSKLDQDGKMIHLVRTARGASVPMLASDIADWIAGRTTGYDINRAWIGGHVWRSRGRLLYGPVRSDQGVSGTLALVFENDW